MNRFTYALPGAVLFILATFAPAPADGQVLPSLASRTIVLPSGLRVGQQWTVVDGSRNADDCDRISLRVATGDAGRVKATVAAGAAGMWWKSVELAVDGQVRENTGTEGNSRGRVLLIHPRELRRAQLVFVKPKTFGVATRVYQLVGLEHGAGFALQFTWNQDHC